MRRLAPAALLALAAVLTSSEAVAQVVVPGRQVPAPRAEPRAETLPVVAALPTATARLAELLGMSTTSPMTRAPWGFGRCAFEVVLPDALGVVSAPGTDGGPVLAGPKWRTGLLSAAPGVVPVRVVGALCRDSTDRDSYIADLHAVVEFQERFALVPLRPAHAITPAPNAVRVPEGGWMAPAVATADRGAGRVTIGITRVSPEPLPVSSAPPRDAERWWAIDNAPPPRATAVPSRRAAASTTSRAPAYSAPSNSGYIRGPRGGCYTYSARGRKRYVDRSLCN